MSMYIASSQALLFHPCYLYINCKAFQNVLLAEQYCFLARWSFVTHIFRWMLINKYKQYNPLRYILHKHHFKLLFWTTLEHRINHSKILKPSKTDNREHEYRQSRHIILEAAIHEIRNI